MCNSCVSQVWLDDTAKFVTTWQMTLYCAGMAQLHRNRNLTDLSVAWQCPSKLSLVTILTPMLEAVLGVVVAKLLTTIFFYYQLFSSSAIQYHRRTTKLVIGRRLFQLYKMNPLPQNCLALTRHYYRLHREESSMSDTALSVSEQFKVTFGLVPAWLLRCRWLNIWWWQIIKFESVPTSFDRP